MRHFILLASLCICPPTLACNTVDDLELLDDDGVDGVDDVESRDQPIEFWLATVCDLGLCRALHPSTADAWVEVKTWREIDSLVEMGKIVPDPVGTGFGVNTCAPGQLPDSVPVTRCFWLPGTNDNVCYGGDSVFAAEISPSCSLPDGFTENHYVAVGCTSDLGAHAVDALLGHATLIESGLLLDGNGAMYIAPGCHFEP